MRVQILTSVVGGGHQSVARALADALADLGQDGLEWWVDDLYLGLARFPVSRFPWLYAAVTRRHRRLWRLIFQLTNRPPGPGRLELLGDPLGGPALSRLLALRRPDSVVSVLPGVNGFLARAIRGLGLTADLEVMVTDWAEIHLSWLSPGIGHYIVPTESAAETCHRVGVPADRVSVLGYPVRRSFARATPGPMARSTARAQLGLADDRFTILAMVGSEGSAGALAHLRALAKVRLDADILVVCGRNARLFREVAGLPSTNRLRPLGFVDDIDQLMLSANLLVTKPGGATLAEACCCHLPIVAFDPLPGQEEGNARYLVARGAAELARSPRHLAELAAELRWAEPRRAELAASSAALARPGASIEAAKEIIGRASARAQDARPG